jgi:hypothetical protein
LEEKTMKVMFTKGELRKIIKEEVDKYVAEEETVDEGMEMLPDLAAQFTPEQVENFMIVLQALKKVGAELILPAAGLTAGGNVGYEAMKYLMGKRGEEEGKQ